MMRNIMIKVIVVILGVSVYFNVSLMIDKNTLNEDIDKLDQQVEDLIDLQQDLIEQLEQAQEEQNEDEPVDEPVVDNCLKLNSITITVIDDDHDFETTVSHCTNETVLGEALDELIGPMNIQFDPRYNKDYVYGRLVVSFYGYDVEPDEYYAIYIGEDYAQYGVDLLDIEDGASYTFTVTGWS